MCVGDVWQADDIILYTAILKQIEVNLIIIARGSSPHVYRVTYREKVIKIDFCIMNLGTK